MKYKIKIFSDFSCPFCYLGKGIIRELKKNFIIEDEWLGFETHPDVPEEGVLLSHYFKGLETEDFLDPLKKRAEHFNLPFKKIDYIYNTSLALEASEYAKENKKYDEFSFEVFKAYFSDNANIAKEDVIRKIADKVDLNSEEMFSNIKTGVYKPNLQLNAQIASLHNVITVPTFIINDEYKISGAQPLEVFEGFLLEIYNNKVFHNRE